MHGEVFLNVGFIPDSGDSFLLPHLTGLRTTVELALTGRTFDANEALNLGLLTRAVPMSELEVTIDSLVRSSRYIVT